MPVGRPRSFDIDEALDRAMEVFWRRGYEGAALSDLTEAMGINRPSLYAAYGNKEELFRKALDRYMAGVAALVREALSAPTAHAAVDRLLRVFAEALADPRTPPGCLLVQGALVCGAAADGIRKELTARRAGAEAALRGRLDRATVEGDLAAGTDTADLARFVFTVIHGMAVQAAGGATATQLQRVAETAMRAWPG